jgi:kynurenine formamidase
MSIPSNEFAPAAAGTRGAPARFGGANVLRGLQAARTGEIIQLSLPLDDPIAPFGRSPAKRWTRLHNQVRPLEDGRFIVINDDEISLALQGSSQWDAFAHFGAMGDGLDGVYLEGTGLAETYPQNLSPNLGINALGPGILARGVLLDIVAHLGDPDGYLDQDVTITREVVETCIERQNVTIEPGDAVLVYTGYQRRRAQADGEFPLATAGLDGSTVPLWEELDIFALASDNLAVEKTPTDHAVHIGMLRGRGVPLGELWALEELTLACRRDGRYEFLLASVPLNYPGAFGSPANAVAVR